MESAESEHSHLVYGESILERSIQFNSLSLSVGNGVPQGTVSGPLFFSIYTNDLSQFLNRKAECVMYADDCAVIVSADSREEVSLKLENVIVLLKNWFQSDTLLMNLKKKHILCL